MPLYTRLLDIWRHWHPCGALGILTDTVRSLHSGQYIKKSKRIPLLQGLVFLKLWERTKKQHYQYLSYSVVFFPYMLSSTPKPSQETHIPWGRYSEVQMYLYFIYSKWDLKYKWIIYFNLRFTSSKVTAVLSTYELWNGGEIYTGQGPKMKTFTLL